MFEEMPYLFFQFGLFYFLAKYREETKVCLCTYLDEKKQLIIEYWQMN